MRVREHDPEKPRTFRDCAHAKIDAIDTVRQCVRRTHWVRAPGLLRRDRKKIAVHVLVVAAERIVAIREDRGAARSDRSIEIAGNK